MHLACGRCLTSATGEEGARSNLSLCDAWLPGQDISKQFNAPHPLVTLSYTRDTGRGYLDATQRQPWRVEKQKGHG